MKQSRSESAKHGLYQTTIRAHHRTSYFGANPTLLFRDLNRPAQYNRDGWLHAQQLFQHLCEWFSSMVISCGGVFADASGKSHWPIYWRFSNHSVYRHGAMVCYAYAHRADCRILRPFWYDNGLGLSYQDAIAGGQLWAS